MFKTVCGQSSWRNSKQRETCSVETHSTDHSDLSGRWLNGPEFLKTPKNEWPKENAKPDPAEVDLECKKENSLEQSQQELL